MSRVLNLSSGNLSVSVFLVVLILFFQSSFVSGEPTAAVDEKSSATGEALDVALSKMTTELEDGIDKKTYSESGILKVAILPVQSGDGMPVSRLGSYVRSTLSIRLIRGKKLTVLDRNTLDKMVYELEFQESELVDPASRKRIGKFLGADVIMASTIFDTGEYVKVSATIYDLTTTLAISAADCRIDRSSIPSFLLRGSLLDNPVTAPDSVDDPDDYLQQSVQNPAQEIIKPKLAEAPVDFELTVFPTEATVAINGEVIKNGGSGLYRIVRPEGRYALSIYHDGYRKYSSVMNLIRGLNPFKGSGNENFDKTVALSPLSGIISLNILDENGTVYYGPFNVALDGELIEDIGGRSINCPPGTHNIEIAIENYYQIKTDVTVVDGATSEIVVNLVRKPVEPEIGTEMVNSVAMKLMWVPSGSFYMGSPPDESGRMEDEGPVHEVEITRGFWLGKYEVTQRQFSQIMGREPSRQSGMFRPVEGISYEDSAELCKKLSKAENRKYRLPTEAEWEYACRAGTSKVARGSELARLAWYRHNSIGRSRNVGELAPNPWGLCDMLGNVKEWCSDFYGPYFSSAMTDPTGPAYGSYRILKGGSWFSSEGNCRPAYRADRADYPYSLVGFRIVCEQ